jgi:uncharacterized protein (TIGR00251 family)
VAWKGEKGGGKEPVAVLSIRVIPRSKKNEIAQFMEDGTIKIRITAPPAEGKANEALIKFLAEALQVSPGQVRILAGQTGRNKRIQVEGIELESVQERISSWLGRHEK